MKGERALLFVGAHPDDETFGIGGTLAKYAGEGVRVVYACATRGEAGSVEPEHMQGFATVGELRWAELACAAKLLGLAEVIHLGYRDSGMQGSTDNDHPGALMRAPQEEVVGKIVRSVRRLRPQVVVTFDPIGGYRHPDHIAVHNATVLAFRAAGDLAQYPDAGAAFSPSKLYFSVFPRGLLRMTVKLMPLFGKDPRRFGKNGDIDLVSLAEISFPVNAVVGVPRRFAALRDQAAACHASQSGGKPPRREMFGMLLSLLGERDLFMRAYPAPRGGRKEKDLFEGT